jgi:AcrR family transcriptional regulator
MAQSDKLRRKYHSDRRQEQARETRRQIVAAARKLFPEYGYAGTTIEALAREAGVAPETIFATFGSKRAILDPLIDEAVGGDDQPIPLLQRPGPQSVLREPDPIVQVQRFAPDIASILARVAPIFEILRMAAKTEPDIADLLKNMLNQRLKNLSVFVEHLAAHGPLRTGLGKSQAAETVWAITSPELYRLLTVDRGWSHERYVQWLGDTLTRLLLP